MSRVANPHRRSWIVSALLLALVVRALIPAGFMPAAGFSFQICPDDFPAHLLRTADATSAHGSANDEAGPPAHHHHSQTGSEYDSPASHEHGVAAHLAHSDAGVSHGDAAASGNAPLSHDDGSPHRHASAGTEHCVFAGAASPALLAWTATFFSQLTAVEQAPEFVYVVPALQPLRFRVQQPRGPPALA